jgi:N utilization substance protein A
MAISKFSAAINQICDEKGLSKETVLEIIENALAAAYRKDYGQREQEVEVKFNEETGEASVFLIKEIVDKVEDEDLQISLAEAKKNKKDVKIGDKISFNVTPADYGRIAAQTAKQVITQRIKEAERDILFDELKSQERTLLNGIVQQIKNNNVFIDLGKVTAIMFPAEQILGEKYYLGQRIRVYMVKVEDSSKGPQVFVSRAHPEFLKKIFELEVPEIPAGTVEIKSIAREAGARSKIAVFSKDENIDPVGSCVGQRGMRVQSVLSELGKEKIDIVLWDADLATFITNALSPAKVTEINVDSKKQEAKVKVPEDQLSLAIGKGGQNVRLAAKLTGWKVDIEGAEVTKEKSTKLEQNKEKNNKEEKKVVDEPIIKTKTEKEIKEIKEGETVSLKKEKKDAKEANNKDE